MPDSVYWDSCLFIDFLQQNRQERFDACEALQIKAVKNELVIVTSALTITEVNKLPGTKMLPIEQSEKILKFFENPYIAIRPVDRQTAELAHELTRTHNMPNIDAIHVATAIIAKVAVLYTYDDKKGKRKGLLCHNMKVGTPPLRIEIPPLPSAGPLFEKTEGEAATDQNGPAPATQS